MKIIIPTPNFDILITPQLQKQLETVGEIIAIKKIRPYAEVTELFQGNEERIVALDPDFSSWGSIPNEVIDKIPNLKAICLQTTSFSWIDVEHMKKKNIPVTNLRGFSRIAVAEWATMMALLLARKIPLIIQENWKQDYTKHTGIELRGKTAGVIGLGMNGIAMAENMQGLGMNVIYWSKNTEDKRFTKVSLEELMQTADVILPAVAKNPETKGLLTDEMLRTMKKTAIFVSTVHDVYSHQLLLDMASKNDIYGYGFEENNGDPRKYKGNVWAGPELGWCTEESMKNNAQQWVESIVLAAKGEYPTQINK